MRCTAEPFDYRGALIVIETDAAELVFIHPPGAPPQAPASLTSSPHTRPGTTGME
jgi:hypothetical protein